MVIRFSFLNYYISIRQYRRYAYPHTAVCIIIDLSTIFFSPSKETCVVLASTKKIFFIFRLFWLMALFELDLTYVFVTNWFSFLLCFVVVVVVFFLSSYINWFFPFFLLSIWCMVANTFYTHSRLWCSGVALFLYKLFVMVIFVRGKIWEHVLQLYHLNWFVWFGTFNMPIHVSAMNLCVFVSVACTDDYK